MVLPICKACLDSGCNIIVVRAARQNAKAKHARMEVDRVSVTGMPQITGDAVQ